MSIRKDFEDFDPISEEFVAVPTLQYLATQTEILKHIDEMREENEDISRSVYLWYSREGDRIAANLRRAYALHEELNYLSWPKPETFERSGD